MAFDANLSGTTELTSNAILIYQQEFFIQADKRFRKIDLFSQ